MEKDEKQARNIWKESLQCSTKPFKWLLNFSTFKTIFLACIDSVAQLVKRLHNGVRNDVKWSLHRRQMESTTTP